MSSRFIRKLITIAFFITFVSVCYIRFINDYTYTGTTINVVINDSEQFQTTAPANILAESRDSFKLLGLNTNIILKAEELGSNVHLYHYSGSIPADTWQRLDGPSEIVISLQSSAPFTVTEGYLPIAKFLLTMALVLTGGFFTLIFYALTK